MTIVLERAVERIQIERQSRPYRIVTGGQGPAGQGLPGDPGAPGEPGADGLNGYASGFRFAFSTTTTDADPGNGVMRTNNATFASITSLFIDLVDAAGATVTAWIERLDDSTNTADRAALRLEASDDPNVYMEFVVSGSVTSATGYRKVAVTPVASAGTFGNGRAIVVTDRRTGNKGADGAGTGDMIAATYDPAGKAAQVITVGDIQLFATQAAAAAATIGSTNVIIAGGEIYERVTGAHPRLGPNLALVTSQSKTNGGASPSQSVAIVAGQPYLVECVAAAISATMRPRFTGGSTVQSPTATSTIGYFATIFAPGVGNNALEMYGVSATSFTLNSISLRALPADAFQSADGAWWAKPIVFGSGDMLAATYDPAGKAAQVLTIKDLQIFATQAAAAAATITGTDFILAGGDVFQRVTPTHPMLGPEVAVNGTFAVDANWLKGTDWTISTGEARVASGAGVTSLTQASLTVAQTYLMSVDLTVITPTGGFNFGPGVYPGGNVNATGNYWRIGTAGNANISLIKGGNFVGSADNVSVKALPADAFSSNGGTVWWARPSLAARTNANNTFSKAQAAAFATLTDGATITPDATLANNFNLTLAGNRTLANPSNMIVGQDFSIVIRQDATGSRTLAYGSQYKFVGAAPALSTAANAIDVLTCKVISSTEILCSLSKGFA